MSQPNRGTSSLTCWLLPVSRINSEFTNIDLIERHSHLQGRISELTTTIILHSSRNVEISFQHCIFQKKEQPESSRKCQEELHQGELNHADL